MKPVKNKRNPSSEYDVWRRPCIPEDEGCEFYQGTIGATSKTDALRKAAKQFGGDLSSGGTYFKPSDFRVSIKESS